MRAPFHASSCASPVNSPSRTTLAPPSWTAVQLPLQVIVRWSPPGKCQRNDLAVGRSTRNVALQPPFPLEQPSTQCKVKRRWRIFTQAFACGLSICSDDGTIRTVRSVHLQLVGGGGGGGAGDVISPH